MKPESDKKDEHTFKPEKGRVNHSEPMGNDNCSSGSTQKSPWEAKTEIQIHDDLPLEITDKYRRFNQKYTVYNRGVWDSKIEHASIKLESSIKGILPPLEEQGFTPIDYAQCIASWIVNDYAAAGSQFGIPNQGLYQWDIEPNINKREFNNPEETSGIIKKAAQFLGASLVGIADYDERWVYSNLYHLLKKESMPVDFPFKPKSVIVIAIEIDYKSNGESFSGITVSAKGLAYSRMAETAYKVATFIRHLGYRAIPCGNDTALSVPLAIMAGLGECGRNGLLITREHGSRIGICKIFTELELKPDKPITFGIKEFCTSCKKCAEACPSKAISMEEGTTFKGINISNSQGIDKWYTNAEKCFQFWVDNSLDCFRCITVCPFNTPQNIHHDLAQTLAVAEFSRPESTFGFDKSFNDKGIRNWWNR
ncbi:MAG: reductive dehalogenase [Dehalobacter sp. 4CP]|uniref:reductive dehalogenase n=1 Tax=Dehalobacter sp. CP TaxID=2594474 RepID=UPI0013C86FEE|nr:reductive dehalogenase [Dehalobacter sp. 4CP]